MPTTYVSISMEYEDSVHNLCKNDEEEEHLDDPRLDLPAPPDNSTEEAARRQQSSFASLSLSLSLSHTHTHTHTHTH